MKPAPQDDVAVALRALRAGEAIDIDGTQVRARMRRATWNSS
jgi:hypothetical protein